MPNYKDANNKVHFIESIAFEYLLPAGCVPITDEEAEELNPKPAPIDPKIQESLSYLASTDWYYTRLAETGQVVPEDVLNKRIAARAYLNEVQ